MTYPKFKKKEHCVRTKKIHVVQFSKFRAKHFITRDETLDMEKFAKNS